MSTDTLERFALLLSKLPPPPSLPVGGVVIGGERVPDPTPPKPRARVGATLMERMVVLQGGLCPLCSLPLTFDDNRPANHVDRPSWDHVVPRVQGGKTAGNRLVAHRGCNSRKGGSSPTRRELEMRATVNAGLGWPNRFPK